MVSETTRNLIESEKGECNYTFTPRDGGPANSDASDVPIPAFYIEKKNQNKL